MTPAHRELGRARLLPGRAVAHPWSTKLDSPFSLIPHIPGAVKTSVGRDALLHVRDARPNTDAEHRVPTESGL